jgi:Transposase, Mutator family
MGTTRTATKTGPRDLTAEVAFLTRALKAPTLRESVTRLTERAKSESWSHEEFLVACLQREVSARESHGGGGASFVEALMGADAEAVCGAPYGARSEERTNIRNGYRRRNWDTRVGTIELAIRQVITQQRHTRAGRGRFHRGRSRWLVAAGTHF